MSSQQSNLTAGLQCLACTSALPSPLRPLRLLSPPTALQTQHQSPTQQTLACTPLLKLTPGRTLCKLHLLPHTLHADFNGDGVVDHVTVAHGLDDDDASGSGTSSTGSSGSHACVATATSGIPPKENLFTVCVCVWL